MSDARDVHRYWHAEHCGVYADVKTSGTADAQKRAKDLVETACIVCGATVRFAEVGRFEHERYTALEDDCKNCGEVIVFIPDMLEWRHHESEDVAVTEPVYGLKSCMAAMTRLLGLPAATSMPEYAGMVAEPTGTHVNLDLATGEEVTNKEAAIEAERKATRRKKAQEKAQRTVTSMSPSLRRSLEGG